MTCESWENDALLFLIETPGVGQKVLKLAGITGTGDLSVAKSPHSDERREPHGRTASTH